MTAEFDMSELVALAAELDLAADKIEPVVESKVLTNVARQVRSEAARDAPSDTGELADSVYIRGGKGYRIVGSDKKQGFFQEHGTSRHPPQPWLHPAADRGATELARLLGEVADPLTDIP